VFFLEFPPGWADRRGIDHAPDTSSGEPPHGSAPLRRLLTGYQPWILLSGALILWFLSAPARSIANRQFGVISATLLYFVAMWAIRSVSRRQDLPVDFRRGLRWVAAGLLINGLGGLCVLAYAVFDPRKTSPFDLSDFLFLSTYPALVAGILSMPRVERASISFGRIGVDAAVLVAGVGLPLWFFAVAPGLRSASGFEAVMDVVYPLMTFSGIAALNFALLTRKPLPSPQAFRLLMIAIAISWLADLLYLLDSVQGYVARGPVNWANVFNVLSIVVYIMAAGRIKADPIAQAQTAQPTASSPLPMVTIVVVSAWLVLFAMKGHPASEAISPIFWILALLFVILSVRETYFIRDSQRWMSAEIERKSRARFEAVVQNSSDVIMVVDTELVVRFASPASAEALGRPPEDITGRTLLSFVHPDDLQKGAAFLDSVKAPYMAPPTIVWRMSRPDLTHRHFETVGSNLVHEPALGGLVLNSRDVTDRVTLEEKLRQSQKLEALGQLVGGIAHNFNNILTSTMMRLSFLRVDRKLPPDLLEEIQALEKEAKRTAALTKKLVMFGQQQILMKEPLNLRDRLTGLLAEITRIMGQGIQVYMTGVSSPEWVEVDAGLIDQVILSLCANAHDAMAAGGCLIVELSEFNPGSAPAVRDGHDRRGSFARLSFQDTGCGMDSAVRQHLFEPFFTTKGVGEAQGLGLAVVHGIVKQHGGWMEVESSPGLGSTFRVFLPKAPGPRPV